MPGLFPPRPTIQANYDWIDLANASGYIVFDGLNAKDSTGNKYILFEASNSSRIIADYVGEPTVTNITATADIGQPNRDLDIDFDSSQFQLPKTIKGDVIVRVCIGGDDTGGGVIDGTYVIAKLRKYSVATGEVEIASGQTVTKNIGLSSSNINTIKINVATPTLIKKGELIRLTIEVWTQDAVGGSLRLPHSPTDITMPDVPGQGGVLAAGTTRLTAAIPFRLDFL